MTHFVTLWDWRRRIAGLYADIRAADDPQAAWLVWRRTRDALFGQHPQSPLDVATQARFGGLRYFDYDPELRLTIALTPIDGPVREFAAGADGEIAMQPFARTDGLQAALGGELTLFWISFYGGGVFLPFTDATSGRETFGAGRYLLDTIKSADLGTAPNGRIVLDFNFSYFPSCAYSEQWVCPLAPAENRLPAPVRAGERL